MGNTIAHRIVHKGSVLFILFTFMYSILLYFTLGRRVLLLPLCMSKEEYIFHTCYEGKLKGHNNMDYIAMNVSTSMGVSGSEYKKELS